MRDGTLGMETPHRLEAAQISPPRANSDSSSSSSKSSMERDEDLQDSDFVPEDTEEEILDGGDLEEGVEEGETASEAPFKDKKKLKFPEVAALLSESLGISLKCR